METKTKQKNVDEQQTSSRWEERLVMPLRVLRLTLKKKWFDMIASGEKKHEYRQPSEWILSRLTSEKKYDVVEFSNGYGKNAPRVTVEYKGWDRNQGGNNPEWGAAPGERYVIIRLGRVISLHNAERRHSEGETNL